MRIGCSFFGKRLIGIRVEFSNVYYFNILVSKVFICYKIFIRLLDFNFCIMGLRSSYVLKFILYVGF